MRAKLPITAGSQRGAVLVVVLVFLVVLTLIATGSMETSLVEARMAGNLRDYNLAFQAAEASLEAGEDWLEAQVELPAVSSNGSTIVWATDSPDPDADDERWWGERDAAWWTANAEQAAGLEGVAEQPRYIIEELFSGFQGQSLAIGTGEVTAERVVHRVTARGVGGGENTQVILQSTYIRPYD